MQTVAASVILDDLYQLMSWDQTQLETRQEQMARSALSSALQEVWEAWWWAELMKCETLAGAPVYDPTENVSAQDVRYFPATRRYYEAVQPSTGTSPAALDATGAYQTAVGFWTLAQQKYCGPDYDPTQTAYALGTTVRNPGDGLYYQIYNLNTYLGVSGAGQSGADGQYSIISQINGRNFYGNLGTPWVIFWDGAQWVIEFSAINIYLGAMDVPTPDLVTNWVATGPTYNPVPTVAIAIIGPPDTNYWTVLNEFVPTIVFNGDLRMVSIDDPRATANPTPLDTEPVADGTRVHGFAQGVFWIWYRRPTPILTGDAYDPTLTYAATPPQDLVFDS